MIELSKEELLKLAHLSALKLDESEVNTFQEQLMQLLEYSSALEHVQGQATLETPHNVNVYRDDKTVQQDSTLILEQAPQREDSYFVVPKILLNH